MRRTKWFSIRRIVLGLAIVAILAPVAQAKPTPAKEQMWTEIPYLSHGTLTPSDSAQTTEQTTVKLGPGEIPYLSHGTLTVGPGEIPYFDDGSVLPSSGQGMPVYVADDGGGYDVGFGVVSSAIILLLLALSGALVAIRHSRKTRLSPA